MKILPFLIFISAVLGIYFLINTFLYYQTRPVFQLAPYGRHLKIIFRILVLAYPLGRLAEFLLIGSTISEWMVKIGSVWLAFMFYLALLFILYLILVPVIEYILKYNIKLFTARLVAIGTIYCITGLIVFFGFLNARVPQSKHIQIKTTKNIGHKPITMAVVSDIHLGTIIGKTTLQKMVNTIQQQKPNLVFLVGDIFDEKIAPVINDNVDEVFKLLSSKFPVYAVTGNHEFIGDANKKIDFLQQQGIAVLLDTTISLSNLNIIGRIDRGSEHMSGWPRKPLQDLIKNVDLNKFTILLDHQPLYLDEAVTANVDLQLSGHTHHGQLFPLNYITEAMFEVSQGYKKKGETHFYISTGFGTWGPRVRIGNRPEVVFITLTN